MTDRDIESPPADPHCIGCGQIHGGGGNLELHCLRKHLIAARLEVQRLQPKMLPEEPGETPAEPLL